MLTCIIVFIHVTEQLLNLKEQQPSVRWDFFGFLHNSYSFVNCQITRPLNKSQNIENGRTNILTFLSNSL